MAVGPALETRTERSPLPWCLGLFGLGLALFLPWLGNIHLFDWDEINFAEAAREMLVSKDYLNVQIDFWPFWEKPPLFIWMQALAMNVFGITEFAARLPNAICGALVLPLLYTVGRQLRGHVFGLSWALCYLGSFLPHFYFRTGIIDPFFNAFMFVAIVLLARGHAVERGKALLQVAFAGLFAGLAVLTKGPVALLIVGGTWALTWFWDAVSEASELGRKGLAAVAAHVVRVIPWIPVLVFLLTLSLASLGWFAAITVKDGGFFVSEFLIYQVRLLQTQDAGHGGPIYYHVVAILLGCFPASFLLFELKKGTLSEVLGRGQFARWMLVAGLFVLVLFSLVQTKIVHYSSMTYYPLTFFAALVTEKLIRGEARPSRPFLGFFFAFAALLALVISALPFVGYYAPIVAPYLRDETARAALLEQKAHWHPAQALTSLPFLVLLAVAVGLSRKSRNLWAVASVTAAVSSLVLCLSAILAPSIEDLVQGPVIRFAKTAAERGCHVDVLGHKSFIQLYYGGRMPEPVSTALVDGEKKPETRWDERMQRIHGPWKKPVVFIAKERNLPSVLSEYPVRVIKQSQGFAYLYRPAVGIADDIAACGFLSE